MAAQRCQHRRGNNAQLYAYYRWRIQRISQTAETSAFDLITNIKSLDQRLSFLAAPNPYTDQIKLQYTLPTAAAVKIDLFNALGQRVAQIAQLQQSSGTHTHTYNGAPLPNGIYWIQLTVGNETTMHKIQKM